jgi:excisionase family DNA binding protein
VSLTELAAAIRDLVARSPVSSEELITAEQLGELFRMSPRTLRDLAASGHIPHHGIGKHYRFSRDDIAEILQMTRQIPRSRRSRPRVA